jgi:small conductance mechanosensitive channel
VVKEVIEVSDDFVNQVTIWGLRILSAALILGIGTWLAYFLSKVVREKGRNHPHIDTTLITFVSVLLRYAILAVVLLAVLQNFGIQTTSLVAVLGAGALAIGLALQGTLGNVASGIMIALLRPYKLQDYVEINGKEGEVIGIDLFFTELLSYQGQTIHVPNGQVVSNPIVNYSRAGAQCCVVTVGIGYEDDIDQALGVMRDIMTGDRRALLEPSAWLGVEELGEFAVNVTAQVWVKTEDHFRYKADMLHLVKEAFDREGIEMPYPHAVELSKGDLAPRHTPIKPARQAA